ncbi:MAG TPA: DUF501 domain-containing protein [Limnochordales bacterium]
MSTHGDRPAFLLFPWWELPSPHDVATIGAQIGRPARGVLAVAWRCHEGKPGVAVVAPVIAGERSFKISKPDSDIPNDPPGGPWVPFPTTFWLCCPAVVARVSMLESTGWIQRLEQELRAHPEAARELEAAHREAARLRQQLLAVQPELRRRAADMGPGALRRLVESGVAGIRHPQGVKCLHAHLADFLGRWRNPVGRRVAELLVEGVAANAAQPCRFCGGRPEPALEEALSRG